MSFIKKATNMREHTWFECKCNKPYCQFCEGGLGACTVCNGFEGTLTVECCGRKITEEESRLIYKERKLNYVNGEWINYDKDCIIKSYDGYSEYHGIKTTGAFIEHKKSGLIFNCSEAPKYNSNLIIVKMKLIEALKKRGSNMKNKWENLIESELASVKKTERTYDVKTLQEIIDKRDNFRSVLCSYNREDSEEVKAYILKEWAEYLKRPAYVDDSNCINVLVIGGDTFCQIAVFCQ